MATYKQYDTKTKGSLWKVTGYLGTDDLTGKQVNIDKRGFKTKKEAQLYFNREKVSFEEGDNVKDNGSLTFNDVYEEWLASYRNTVRGSTLKNTTGYYRNHVKTELGNVKINKITTKSLQILINKWHKKNTLYKRLMNLVKRVLNYAINQGYISSNPANSLIIPKKKKKPKLENDINKDFYSRQELEHVMDCLGRMDTQKWHCYFRILAFTGLRRGEALGLKWSDIDVVNQELTVQRTISHDEHNQPDINEPKTESSYRTISLDNVTIKVIKKWRIEQRETMFGLGFNVNGKDQFVFSKLEDNTPLNITTPRNAWVKICERFDLRYIRIHGFRHTHTSLLIEAGIPIRDVMERLGHSDIKTTMNIYAHVTPEQKEKTAQLFANYVDF